MHYQKYSFANAAKRMPALLAVDHAVFAEDEVRVCEDPRCHLKVHSRVLLLV